MFVIYIHKKKKKIEETKDGEQMKSKTGKIQYS